MKMRPPALLMLLSLLVARICVADCGPFESCEVSSSSGNHSLHLEFDRDATLANRKILSERSDASCFRFRLSKLGEMQREGLLWGVGHHLYVLVPDSGDRFVICDPHAGVGIYDNRGSTIALYLGDEFLDLDERLHRPFASGCHPEGCWDDGKNSYQLSDDQQNLQLTVHSGRKVVVSLSSGRILSGAPQIPETVQRVIVGTPHSHGVDWFRVGVLTLLGAAIGTLGLGLVWVLGPRSRLHRTAAGATKSAKD
jgi:hypothetical protein